MTVLMDDSSDNSSREHVQHLYNKNVELESRRRKAAQARIPSDPNAWQQMRENYEAIILEDYAFAEQHEVEYALWQLHYRRIEELRAHLGAALASTGSTVQNGKVPTRPGPDRVTKIRSQFKTFLSEATGFYHDLMLKIRAKYGLPLGYSDDPESQIGMSKDGNKSTEVKKGLISSHRCLIYLGDLARYKGLYGEGDSKAQDFAAASSYYMQASSLWPSSGNPHHQLAILASYSGDELVAIYRYFRSLAVENPFTTARDNLIIAFEKNRQSYSQLTGDAKVAPVKAVFGRGTGKGRGKGENKLPPRDVRAESNLVKDKASIIPEIYKAFSIRFVRLNGILFTRTSMETFGEVFSVVKSDLLELLSSGLDEEYNFGADATECRLVIIRLIVILMFTVHNVNRENENQSYAEILQRSVLLENAFTAIFEFMGQILGRCVQLNDPTDSYLLPGILVFVEWLACHQDIAAGTDMDEKQASARSFFWNHCISFLNKLMSSGCMSADESEDETCFFNMSRYDEDETANRFALFEDFELRGFLPLLPAQLILDYSRKHLYGSDGGNQEKKVRVQRIIAAGKALANTVRIGQEGISFDWKLKRFVVGVEPQISDDHSLSNLTGMFSSDGMQQEFQLENQPTLGFLQPKPHLYVDGEEEDEVIVFQPSITEKNVDGMALIAKQPAVSVSGVSTSDVESRNGVGCFSNPLDGFLLQSASNTNTTPLLAVSDITALQPIQPSISKWLVEKQGSIANGLANLNLLENSFAKNLELQDRLGVMQPTALSVPFPQPVNPSAGNNYPIQALETVLPSKFDAFVSSGVNFDRLPIKPSVGLKKNPVSRPVRHHGPPPGFGSVPHKLVDDPFSAVNLKSENPLKDDYSWLDEYQLPASTQAVEFSSSINHLAQAYPPAGRSNSSTGMVSFPFPGKQVSALHVQKETHKGRPDTQFSDHLKLYQEQQQQLHKGNQLPRQYQGQSLWEGSFFV